MRQSQKLNRALELHDSKLASLGIRDDMVVVELRPAHIHSSSGVAGIDPGEIHLQDVDIVVLQAELPDSFPDEPVSLSDGKARIGEQNLDNMLAIPLFALAAATLELVLVSGQRISVQGSGLELILRGEPKFLERFSP